MHGYIHYIKDKEYYRMFIDQIINSAAKIKGAGFQADAIEAQGASQGQQSMMSGIGSMVSGIAGGFGSMGSGGGGGGTFGATNSPGLGIPINDYLMYGS